MLKKIFSKNDKETSTPNKTTVEKDIEDCRAVIIFLMEEFKALKDRVLAIENLAVTTAQLGEEISTNLTIIEHFLIEKDILPTIDKIELN